MDILIIGAGGHAQVVADIIQCMRRAAFDVRAVGYLDDADRLHGNLMLGIPVLGPISKLKQIPHDAVVIAIGNNMIRSRFFEELKNSGETLTVARHPQSVIAGDVKVGHGCMICAGVVVNTGSTIGENVILNTGCTVDHHNHIANSAHIAPGAHLGGEVHVGEGTLVGLGAAVMPQRRVGAWSVVAAGAVVHRDVPDEVSAVGVPARIVPRAAR